MLNTATSPSFAQAELFKRITIEGYRSQSTTEAQRLTIEAENAEFSKSLQQQRLYNLHLKSEGPAFHLDIAAHQGLFRGSEIVLSGAVSITHLKILPSPKTVNKNLLRFSLSAKEDLVSIDFKNRIILGNTAELVTPSGQFEGQGFRIDLTREQVTWVGSVKKMGSLQKYRSPITLPLYK